VFISYLTNNSHSQQLTLFEPYGNAIIKHKVTVPLRQSDILSTREYLCNLQFSYLELSHTDASMPAGTEQSTVYVQRRRTIPDRHLQHAEDLYPLT